MNLQFLSIKGCRAINYKSLDLRCSMSVVTTISRILSNKRPVKSLPKSSLTPIKTTFIYLYSFSYINLIRHLEVNILYASGELRLALALTNNHAQSTRGKYMTSLNKVEIKLVLRSFHGITQIFKHYFSQGFSFLVSILNANDSGVKKLLMRLMKYGNCILAREFSLLFF